MATPAQPRAAAEKPPEDVPDKTQSPRPDQSVAENVDTSPSISPLADLRPWPPSYQAAYYAYLKIEKNSRTNPVTSLPVAAQEALRNQVMAEVFRPTYFQWRLANQGPYSPLVAYSHVRTARDLASMLFHLQMAVAVDGTTHDLVDASGGIYDAPAGQPMLFVDAAGDRLGAQGRSSVTMVTILVRTPRLHHLYLVDVLQLGGDVAFDTEVAWADHRDCIPLTAPLHQSTIEERCAIARGEWEGTDGLYFAPVEVAVGSIMPFVPSYRTPRTPWTLPGFETLWPTPPISLRRILEASGVAKVFFDVRHDASALLARHQIRLRGALDLQLIEIAARNNNCLTYIRGIDDCLSFSDFMPPPVMHAWRADHYAGRSIFENWEETRQQRQDLAKAGGRGPSSSALSGSDQTVKAPFARRPLDPVLLRYAINNVVHLPALLDCYQPLVALERMPKLATEMVIRTVCANTTNEAVRTSSPWCYTISGKPVEVQPVDWSISEESAFALLPVNVMATVNALRNELPPFLRDAEPARPSRSARRRWAKKMAGG